MAKVAVGFLWLTINIYFEARNQPFEGMKAVGHTVMNRVEARKLPVKQIVWQKKQYSWTNQNDPQGAIIRLLNNADQEALDQCAKAAWEVLEEQISGETMKGITHYHHKNILPHWADGVIPTYYLEDHYFYAGIK